MAEVTKSTAASCCHDYSVYVSFVSHIVVSGRLLQQSYEIAFRNANNIEKKAFAESATP